MCVRACVGGGGTHCSPPKSPSGSGVCVSMMEEQGVTQA